MPTVCGTGLAKAACAGGGGGRDGFGAASSLEMGQASSSEWAPGSSGTVFFSNLGTMSMRKSNCSFFAIAMATSFFWSVFRLLSSVCAQARSVSSCTNLFRREEESLYVGP